MIHYYTFMYVIYAYNNKTNGRLWYLTLYYVTPPVSLRSWSQQTNFLQEVVTEPSSNCNMSKCFGYWESPYRQDVPCHSRCDIFFYDCRKVLTVLLYGKYENLLAWMACPESYLVLWANSPILIKPSKAVTNIVLNNIDS